MQIEFDQAKDVSNQTKHGVSLSLANELNWEAALVWVDDRFEYGELRMIALAPKTGILYSTTWHLLNVAKCEGLLACAKPIVAR